MTATCLVLFILPWTAAESGNGFDVGSRAQLFVDRTLVRSAEDVTFTLHPEIGRAHV